MTLFNAGERRCEKARAGRSAATTSWDLLSRAKGVTSRRGFAKVLTVSFRAAAALKPVFNEDKNAPEHAATMKHVSEYVT